MKVDPFFQNQVLLRSNEVIVGVNGEDLLDESRDK